MNCRQTRARLDALVDDELPAGERSRVERHLGECGDCRADADGVRELVARASRLPREVSPPRDLYPGILERIASREARRPGASAMPWSRAVAAGLLLALAGAIGIWWRAGSGPRPGPAVAGQVTPALHEGAGPPLDAAVREYVEAAELLRGAIDGRRNRLAPETLVVLEQNLAIVDGAIAKVHAALAADPASPGHASALRAMHARKLDLLRRFTRLST